MAYQTVFKRYELKYMLTAAQKARVLSAIDPYMRLDSYGRTVIRNIYFDTDSYRLIRRSMDKPEYKEKLRIRSYCCATPDTDVFVELKKKYKSVVYKRRMAMREREAVAWVEREEHCVAHTQISEEIDYFLDFYGSLAPRLFLSYEREAYYSLDGSDFRVTFDENILAREDDLTLESESRGTPILDTGCTLMEIKCSGGIPMWMAGVLSRERIYRTSFSKYGTAYKNIIYPRIKEKDNNA